MQVREPSRDISEEELRGHITFLASDALEGRKLGSRGERAAAEYIEQQLASTPRLGPGGSSAKWRQEFPAFVVHDSNGVGSGTNVLAVLGGSEPELDGMPIVVGAHYDHLGSGDEGVYNGADDNASGSAALLEIAECLAGTTPAPRHTILFHWYSGEEGGLYGSEFAVQALLKSGTKPVVMLNLDMIGRLRGRQLMIGGLGSSSVLKSVIPGMARRREFAVVEEDAGIASSDALNFYLSGVPVCYLFTGLHADYHKTTDDIERLNTDGIREIANVIVEVIQALDRTDGELPYKFMLRKKSSWEPALASGMVLVPAAEGGIAVVESLTPGGAAQHAGLVVGDVILRMNGSETWRLKDLELATTSFDGWAARETELQIRRRTADGGVTSSSEFAVTFVPGCRS